jgi:hypothetical protein
MNSIIKSAANFMEELSQLYGKSDAKQDEIQQTKAKLGEVLKKKWKNKVMHGQNIRNMDRELISEEDTFLWLSKGELKAETESEMVAAQYIKRHDRVSAQLHFNICKETGVQMDKKHWYEHVPKSVETSQGGKVNILWNQQVQTDRTIPNNKPDIIIRDNQKGTCMLIDVAISGDRNVIKKEAD